MIADVFTVAAVVAGCLFFTAGTIGLLRFPDTNMRLHALVKADNVGLGLVLAGLAVQGPPSVAVKLLGIWVLALLAAATSSYLLGTGPPAGESEGETDREPAGGEGTDAGQTGTEEAGPPDRRAT